MVLASLLSSPVLSACRKHCELEKDPRRMTSVLMSVLEQIKVGGTRRCGHVGGAGNVLVHVYLQSFPSLLSLPLPSPTFSKLLQLLCTSPSPPFSFPSISPLHSPPLPLYLPFPLLPSPPLPFPSISPSLPPLSPSPESPLIWSLLGTSHRAGRSGLLTSRQVPHWLVGLSTHHSLILHGTSHTQPHPTTPTTLTTLNHLHCTPASSASGSV